MSHAYRFKLHPGDIGMLIEADSRAEARTIALRDSSLDRLDASEVMAAVRDGKAFARASDAPATQTALPLTAPATGVALDPPVTPHNY